MAVHLHTICWNDATMLPFFFRHYDPWVDHYVIHDDGSTDGSRELLQAHPKVTMKNLERCDPDSLVNSVKHINNTSWLKDAGKDDWVACPSIDEHLFHADMGAYLERCTQGGVNVIPSLGYQMVSLEFPTGGKFLYEQCSEGAPWAEMSKPILFRPGRLRSFEFELGRHTAYIKGAVTIPKVPEVLNLHFKYLDLVRLEKRQRELATGLGPTDVKKRWGFQYFFTSEEIQKDFERFYDSRVSVFSEGYLPQHDHAEPRWWKDEDFTEVAVPEPNGVENLA